VQNRLRLSTLSVSSVYNHHVRPFLDRVAGSWQTYPEVARARPVTGSYGSRLVEEKAMSTFASVLGWVCIAYVVITAIGGAVSDN
jgi:hypothetical protein